jgi:hypothetical protein
MLNMYGIIRYYRCVDDILILVSSDEKLPACFAAFSALIKFFIPEIEEQSSEEVTMLKLVVYMRDGVVHTRTAFKPNSLGVPLDSTSVTIRMFMLHGRLQHCVQLCDYAALLVIRS